MNETLGRQPEAVDRNVRGHLALIGGHVLWRVVGVAVGAIGYAAEAGFELEMRRVAMRSAVKKPLRVFGDAPSAEALQQQRHGATPFWGE